MINLYIPSRVVQVSLCRVLFRVRFEGRGRTPATGPVILAPNHRSLVDIPLAAFATRRPVRYLAKRELFEHPLMRWYLVNSRVIKVDRAGNDRAALRAVQDALEAGDVVGIFPEGTRGSGPVLGPVFDGVAYLALRTGAPIVPVGIAGSEAIFVPGGRLPHLPRIAVVAGEPIMVERREATVRRSEAAALTDRLRAELQACFDRARVIAAA